MFMFKKVIVKLAVSFGVGMTSTIGAKLASTVWDKCASDETCKKKKKQATT